MMLLFGVIGTIPSLEDLDSIGSDPWSGEPAAAVDRCSMANTPMYY